MSEESVKKPVNKKKILIYTVIAIVSAIILMYALLLVLERFGGESVEDEYTHALYSDFESADYSYDIFEDAEYKAITDAEFIRFYDEYTNLTTGVIDVQDAYSMGDDVGFMVEYVYAVIEGNTDKYNSLFSAEYYEEHKAQERFTMQKIYDVLITRKIPNSEVSEGAYNVYYLELQYRILDNNGTFRQDIKDGYKPQYIVITDREGRLLIDSID